MKAGPSAVAGSAGGLVPARADDQSADPKVGVFYVSFLPQFMPPGADTLGWSLLLAGVHGLQTVVWFGALIAATRPLGRWLRQTAVVRWLDGVTGALLVAFGVGLALQKRAL